MLKVLPLTSILVYTLDSNCYRTVQRKRFRLKVWCEGRGVRELKRFVATSRSPTNLYLNTTFDPIESQYNPVNANTRPAIALVRSHARNVFRGDVRRQSQMRKLAQRFTIKIRVRNCRACSQALDACTIPTEAAAQP